MDVAIPIRKDGQLSSSHLQRDSSGMKAVEKQIPPQHRVGRSRERALWQSPTGCQGLGALSVDKHPKPLQLVLLKLPTSSKESPKAPAKAN